MKIRWFWIVLYSALLLRILLIVNPGFEADVAFWKSWGLAAADKGIVEGLRLTNNNYPTPFSYLLALMVNVYRLFASPYDFNAFWNRNNLLFLVIAKLPSIFADFGIAAIILWIGRNANRFGFPILSFSVYCLLSTVYLLNPVSLIDGAWWGQVDSLGVFIFLIACCLSLKRQPFWAGAVFMLAMMTKLQNMIYGPLFFLFLWQQLGYNGLIKGISGAALAFFGLNIEFFRSHEAGRVLGSLTDNFDYFPWMSLNAFNLWWIVSGAKGMQVSDKLLTIGIMNAKTVGLVLFSSVYVFAALRQTFIRRNSLQSFLESLILVNGSFFLFQTQSHDRYAFPLSVFLLLWAPFWIASSPPARLDSAKRAGRAGVKRQVFLFFYLLFTVFYFYNLHTALIFNYPNNGIPGLTGLTQPFFTIITSLILLVLFALFFAYVVRRTKRIVSVVAVAALMTILFIGNLPLFLKKPVSLTKLTPFAYNQGYANLMVNMPANSSLGFDKWSPLSVQYAFYRTGLGTHADSFINYDIAGHFKKFSTDYGIDTQAGDKGTAVFEIYGDGKRLFQSETMGRYTMPRHVEVDINEVKTLGLVTKDAGDGKNDDHTDWLNPLLFP